MKISFVEILYLCCCLAFYPLFSLVPTESSYNGTVVLSKFWIERRIKDVINKYTYMISLVFLLKMGFYLQVLKKRYCLKEGRSSIVFFFFFFQKEANLLYCSVCYKVKYFHSKLGLLHVQLLKCYRIFAHCTAIFLFKFGTLVWSLNCYNFSRFYSAVCFLRAVFNSCSEVPVSYL